MSFTYDYPRPAVTVDIILITKTEPVSVLLIQRKQAPFKGAWALPGGFLDMDEDLQTAALRELEEETHIKNIDLEQFKTYGAVDRDPRGRTVSVVYYALLDTEIEAFAGDDASETQWFKLSELPKLAFDHEPILEEFKAEVMLK